MTIEEKLTHFYDTSVEEARRQAEKDVQEHKDSLDAALEEHKKMSLENAASSRKAEIANAKREINKALSQEHSRISMYLRHLYPSLSIWLLSRISLHLNLRKQETNLYGSRSKETRMIFRFTMQ